MDETLQPQQQEPAEAANLDSEITEAKTADNSEVINEAIDKEKTQENGPSTIKPWLFKKGVITNPKGRPKNKPFSIKDDILKSLRRIKTKQPKLYQQIIDSYWIDPKRREFLLEIIDGKARQSMDITGTMENPVRIVEVRPLEPQLSLNEPKQLT